MRNPVSDDILDATIYAMSLASTKYILFKDNGESMEFDVNNQSKVPVEALTDLVYSVRTSQWFRVEMHTGALELYWKAMNTEDVPAGLRLMALLIK
jgi:hypothetical protein